MRKTVLFVLWLIACGIVMAKDYVIVIKGQDGPIIGQTEVTSMHNDTLRVFPSKDAATISITLKDANDNIYQSYCVPATCNDILSVISPSLPTGLMLEIRDDKGYIYREFD